MGNLIHISLTNFLFESRILKESRTIASAKLFKSIYIIALHRAGLKKVERIDDNIVIRIPLKSRTFRFSSRVFILIELFFRLLTLLKRLKFDVVSFHVIDLLPFSFIIKKFFRNTKIIYDAHELETHTSDNKKRILLLGVIEKIFIHYIDLIIVVNKSIESIYQKRYPGKSVVSVYNSPNYISYRSSNIIRKQLNLSQDKVIFLYQGGLEKGRGIKLLLNAFESMKNTNNVLVFLGYGSLKDEIIKSSLSNRNIYLIDAVEPGEVLSYTQSCDFGLCLIENSCLSYYYSLPNKLLEYLMARKPVLVPNFPEMEFIVRKYKIGTVINEFSNHAILSGIDDIIQIDRTMLITNIENMIKSYSWENQEIELIKSYQKLLNR